MTSDDEQRIRMRKLAEALPEAEVSSRTGQHMKFAVRNRTFGYFLVDHHGDGKVALSCKAPAGARELLLSSQPEKYFVAGYSSPGWVAIDLNGPGVGWDEVAALLIDSYCMVAPKKLAAEVRERPPAL